MNISREKASIRHIIAKSKQSFMQMSARTLYLSGSIAYFKGIHKYRCPKPKTVLLKICDF